MPIQPARRAAGGHVSVGGAPHCPVRRRHTHPWQMPASAGSRGRFACQELRMTDRRERVMLPLSAATPIWPELQPMTTCLG
jgi:hypothetical protein